MRRLGSTSSWLAMAVLLFGCRAESYPLVIGPYNDRPNAQLYASALQAAQAQGYYPTSSDPGRGQFVVASNVVSRWGASHSFTVQCYQEGWIRVIPSGSYVHPAGAVYSMPPALKTELETFVIRLRESLGTTEVRG